MNTQSTLLAEFRRGADFADIYSIAFSPMSTRLCVVSDKSTLHVFNIPETICTSARSSVMSFLPKYFSSDWSFAHYHIPEESRFTTMFFGNDQIFIVTNNNSFYHVKIDTIKGGPCSVEQYIVFGPNNPES